MNNLWGQWKLSWTILSPLRLPVPPSRRSFILAHNFICFPHIHAALLYLTRRAQSDQLHRARRGVAGREAEVIRRHP
jgi:hypothetical protein